MDLRRLVATYTPDGVELRVLYRRTDGPGPNTKARRREVEQLAREGLRHALEALDAGDVESVGTAGFEVREDALFLSNTSSNCLLKGGRWR